MNTYKKDDIVELIEKFQKSNNPKDRYASFDYCYRYFLTSSSKQLRADIEKSCLVLGFYLASWGMLRASSFLLNKSIKYYEPLIRYIASLDKDVWQIDVNNYDEANIKRIICIYKDIKERIIENGNSDLTLITKVMLGVFGCVPAFDENFGSAFRDIFKDSESQGKGFRRVSPNSLNLIKKFYEDNKEVIDGLADTTFVTDFNTGKKSGIKYTKAKIIDMYGFTYGVYLNEQDKKKE